MKNITYDEFHELKTDELWKRIQELNESYIEIDWSNAPDWSTGAVTVFTDMKENLLDERITLAYIPRPNKTRSMTREEKIDAIRKKELFILENMTNETLDDVINDLNIKNEVTE